METQPASSPAITSDVPATKPKIKKPRSGCCWQEIGRDEPTSSRSKKTNLRSLTHQKKKN